MEIEEKQANFRVLLSTLREDIDKILLELSTFQGRGQTQQLDRKADMGGTESDSSSDRAQSRYPRQTSPASTKQSQCKSNMVPRGWNYVTIPTPQPSNNEDATCPTQSANDQGTKPPKGWSYLIIPTSK